jgi:hypothetical protein
LVLYLHQDGRRTALSEGRPFNREGDTMTELITERVTAELEGGFVVFRIGMRINTL